MHTNTSSQACKEQSSLKRFLGFGFARAFNSFLPSRLHVPLISSATPGFVGVSGLLLKSVPTSVPEAKMCYKVARQPLRALAV